MLKYKNLAMSCIVLLLGATATSALAQMSRPTMLKVGDKISLADTHTYVRLQPPFSPAPSKRSLSDIQYGKHGVYVYLDMTQPNSDKIIQHFMEGTKSLKRIEPIVIAYSRDPEHTKNSLDALAMAGYSGGVILDDSRYFAFRLKAFKLPAFAAIEKDGTLRVTKINSLDGLLQNNVSFRQAIAKVEQGGRFPNSDGELPTDITTIVGKMVPDVTLERAPVGAAPYAKLASKDLVKKKKAALYAFWVSTCPHCQREMPHVYAWHQKHASEVELVTVTQLHKTSLVRHAKSYLQKKGLLSMPVYTGTEAFKAFHVEGFPSWAFVGADGKILEARSGEIPDLESLLDETLRKAQR